MFKPLGLPMSVLESLHLGIDELEAMRLCDLEGLDQREAGVRMEVSRGTVQRLLRRGRRKVVEAVVKNRTLVVDPQAASGVDGCGDDTPSNPHNHNEETS